MPGYTQQDDEEMMVGCAPRLGSLRLPQTPAHTLIPSSGGLPWEAFPEHPSCQCPCSDPPILTRSEATTLPTTITTTPPPAATLVHSHRVPGTREVLSKCR